MLRDPLILALGDWVVFRDGSQGLKAAEVTASWGAYGTPRARFIQVRLANGDENIHLLHRQIVHATSTRSEAQQFIAKENER